MARASSASLYGSGTPTDLSRVPESRQARAYGLRSGSSMTGYYPAYGSRPRRKVRRDIVDTQTNLVAPVASWDDDAPAPRFVREVSAVVSFDRETRPDYN